VQRGRTLAVVALASLAFADAAAPAPDAERVIGRKTTSGGFAVATASGSVKRPLLTRVRVEATPNQHAQVTWKLRCWKGTRSALRQGQYRAPTPETRRVLFPMVKPDRCSLSATGQLEQEGTITVTLLAR
jgi:hypothetical protein